MSIPWDVIIPIVVEAIMNCLDKEPDEQLVRQRVRTPSGIALFRIERKTRKAMGLSRKEWRDQGPAIMAAVKAEASQLSGADLDELIAEAKED